MKVIPFLRFRYLTFILSIAIIIAGAVSTWMQGGFNLGLDFQPGVRVHVRIDPSVQAPIDLVRGSLIGIMDPQIQTIGHPAQQEYAIRVEQIGDSRTFGEDAEREIRSSLGNMFGPNNITVLQTEFVGPRFSADLASQAIFLTLFALLLIMAYSWFRFKLAYAIAAIAATVHDPLIMIAIIGATQMEVSTATVAAVLTIIGYSINDTIVVFDRIRENTTLMRESPFSVIINTSISQTLGRTLITSVTTLFAIVAVYLFATGEVQLFALNVIIGVVVGTYSTIFIASPVLLGLKQYSERRRAKRENLPSKEELFERKKPVTMEMTVTEEPQLEIEVGTSQEPSPELVGAARASSQPKLSREKRRRKRR